MAEIEKAPVVKNKRNIIKRQNFTDLFLSLLIIALLNIVGYYLFARIDLTEGKRYSLSKTTKTILDKIEDNVTFTVYLEGDFPAGFKRLRNETKELLDEYRSYNKNIDYKFVDPSEGNDQKSIKNFHKQLIETKGLTPTYITVQTKSGKSQQIIFPAATVFYKGKETPLQLLQTQKGVPNDEVLNNSVQALEYTISNALFKITTLRKPKIAFIEGHGELGPEETASAAYSLKEYYEVDRITLNGKLNSLADRVKKDSVHSDFVNKYEAIIIAKPDSAFNRWDKYLIDQHIMRGGKVLWLIDPVFASMDSLRASPETMGIAQDLNLEDMLFKYGVRLRTNLIMDLNALSIPAPVSSVGGEQKYDYFPWYYSPVLLPASKHPVVNNLNVIKTEFISTIDTVGSLKTKKTILLTTSKYSRCINTPANISIRTLYRKPDERMYKDSYQPVAVLLEGAFNSAFRNMMPPELADNPDFRYIAEGKPTRMIIVSDGDIIKNQIRVSDGLPLPLGYDKYTGQMFGNNDFILNCMNYLTDNSGLIALRASKTFKLRLLDNQKIQKNKIQIQTLNIIIPILIVILFGIIQTFLRRRKFGKSY